QPNLILRSGRSPRREGWAAVMALVRDGANEPPYHEESRLLRGLLARRVEGAGIEDFGDLVIAEAEHLAQDLVGVFAEQRRAFYLGRAIGKLDRVADRQI